MSKDSNYLGLTKREYRSKYIRELLIYILTPMMLLSPWGWESLAWYMYFFGCLRSRVNPFSRVAIVTFYNIIQQTYDDMERDAKLKDIRKKFIDSQWNNL